MVIGFESEEVGLCKLCERLPDISDPIYAAALGSTHDVLHLAGP
jgi:hypothetical protein